MKILLVAINTKYIHSNLAVYSLRAYALKNIYCEETDCHETDLNKINIEIAEYTINQQLDDIMRDIYERRPDILCFSCYIWNLNYVETLVREIGKICPELPIWLGGPEVSYDAKDALRRYPAAKGVMMGEGEITFAKLCQAYAERYVAEDDHNIQESFRGTVTDGDLEKIPGITYRTADDTIRENEWREPMDLDDLPFVYDDMQDFEHKIIYYETSRGCPFSCSYCLSSIDKRLRFRSVDLVKEELKFFLEHKVPQVKFVDRTFNCKHEHALEIWRYIAEHDNGITNFHFEISADLLNEEELSLLETMRPGLIQLEIGVQSTNPDTVREIRRTMDIKKLADNVTRIRKAGNIHQHLDLIAGLPYEDILSFAGSFDDIYALKPHQLQLGFLKVLKGSYMEEKKEEYGLLYKGTPPYEVLCTKWISYEDILKLKGVEEMVEVYYNSRQFEHTLNALEKEYTSAFRMYEELWEYYRVNDLHGMQHKRSARYEILLGFIGAWLKESGISGNIEYYRELLIYDYYLRENAKSRPDFAGENAIDKDFARRFYENEEAEHTFLPAHTGYNKNQMRKMTHLEHFPALKKTILFDYSLRNPLNQEARTCIVEES